MRTHVRGVYICNNFVTITKEMNYDWADIMLRIKGFLKTYVEEGKTIVKDGFTAVKTELDKENQAQYDGDDAAIVTKNEQ